MHAQTLRYYERMGVLKPSRSRGRIRLYSIADVNRLRQIHGLIDDLGVNLAGAEVILRMNQRIQEMNEELEALRRELQQICGTAACSRRLSRRSSRTRAISE